MFVVTKLVFAFGSVAIATTDPVECYKKAIDPFGLHLSKDKALGLCAGGASDPIACFKKAKDSFGLSLSETEALKLCAASKKE